MKQGYRQQPPADDQHGASHLLRAAFDDKDDDSEEAEKRSDDQRSGNEMAPCRCAARIDDGRGIRSAPAVVYPQSSLPAWSNRVRMTDDLNLVQFVRSPAAMQAAPILVLLPVPGAPLDAAGAAWSQDADPKVLGLGLVRRAVLAARRAGYGRVFLLTEDGAETAGAAAIPDWSGLAATFRSSADHADAHRARVDPG